MAQFVRLWERRENLLNELVEAAREADRCREAEYRAAVRIQSWFRGCLVRAYLGILHDSATVVQRHFRGFLGRRVHRARLAEALGDMWRAFYHRQAARIQSAWRGYYVRKYVFDYYAQKRYLEGLERKNQIVQQKIREHWEAAEEERLLREEQMQELLTEDEARRHHYLLSTHCIDGVFNSPNRSKPLPFEERMRAVKFAPLSKRPGKGKQKARQRSLSSEHSREPVAEEEREKLPPVLHRVQGPFRSPSSVWHQRRKPLEPSLRVSTAYNSVEVARAELKAAEWRERVVNEEFLPFSRRERPCYQPLLHSQSPCTQLAYGTKWFRDEKPSMNVAEGPFRTVVPPIPIFDKLNSTY